MEQFAFQQPPKNKQRRCTLRRKVDCSVATYCRCGENLYDMYIENFLTNHLVKSYENRSTFAKVIIKTRGLLFWNTV